MTNLPKPPSLGRGVDTHHDDDEGRVPACIRRKAKMNWIMLLWPSIATVLIFLSAFAWLDTLKTENAVRAHIDDIPFRPNPLRHRDDEHQR
jgi:hypothetical protein